MHELQRHVQCAGDCDDLCEWECWRRLFLALECSHELGNLYRRDDDCLYRARVLRIFDDCFPIPERHLFPSHG